MSAEITEIDNIFANNTKAPEPIKLETNQVYIVASKRCSYMFLKEETMEQAWAIYTHRERYYWGPTGRSGLHTPTWKGQPIAGKTLVLCYEQAIGEQILFSSMIPDLLKLGANLVIEVDKRLVPLLQRSFPEVTFVPWQFPWHEKMYSGDYYTLLGSVGYVLRKTLASFGTPKPYLKAKPMKLPTNLPKIGVSWFSPMVFGGLDKSISYFDLQTLTEKHEKELFIVNLQYGKAAPLDIYNVPGVDLTQDLDTIASIIDSCDYIVTISNTVAHMAGALGKKTYLILKEQAVRFWYWSLPWYSNIEVVEKQPLSTWGSEIEKICKKIIK